MYICIHCFQPLVGSIKTALKTLTTKRGSDNADSTKPTWPWSERYCETAVEIGSFHPTVHIAVSELQDNSRVTWRNLTAGSKLSGDNFNIEAVYNLLILGGSWLQRSEPQVEAHMLKH